MTTTTPKPFVCLGCGASLDTSEMIPFDYGQGHVVPGETGGEHCGPVIAESALEPLLTARIETALAERVGECDICAEEGPRFRWYDSHGGTLELCEDCHGKSAAWLWDVFVRARAFVTERDAKLPADQEERRALYEREERALAALRTVLAALDEPAKLP